MEQQVNLYQPILGAERRIFSARAIGGGLVALGVCLGGLHAFGATGKLSIQALDKLFQIAVGAASSLCKIRRKITMFSPHRCIQVPPGRGMPKHKHCIRYGSKLGPGLGDSLLATA